MKQHVPNKIYSILTEEVIEIFADESWTKRRFKLFQSLCETVVVGAVIRLVRKRMTKAGRLHDLSTQ